MSAWDLLCLNHHLSRYIHFALILLVKSALVEEPSWRRSYWAASRNRAELIVMIAAATITLSCVVGDLSQSPSFITVHHYIVGSSDLDLLHRSGRWTPGLSVIDIYVREWGTHGQRWVIQKGSLLQDGFRRKDQCDRGLLEMEFNMWISGKLSSKQSSHSPYKNRWAIARMAHDPKGGNHSFTQMDWRNT